MKASGKAGKPLSGIMVPGYMGLMDDIDAYGTSAWSDPGFPIDPETLGDQARACVEASLRSDHGLPDGWSLRLAHERGCDLSGLDGGGDWLNAELEMFVMDSDGYRYAELLVYGLSVVDGACVSVWYLVG